MAYMNRPYGHGNNYYDSEYVHETHPYGSYSSEYGVDEYGAPMGHRNHQNGGMLSEVAREVIPGNQRHRHGGLGGGGSSGFIERAEERILEKGMDYYRRNY